MANIFFYDTAIGKLGIVEHNDKITNLLFKNEALSSEYILEETPVLKKANVQLQEYFKGQRKEFTLPLAPEGTEFMKSVWAALCSIPYGESRSYKDIAIIVGNGKACRAVGMANNKNPLPILIPCHRVIGSNGKLVGYGGGLDIKSYLLNLESNK